MLKVFKRIAKYHFDPYSPIGEGNFGKVYVAFEDNDDNKKVALKVIPLDVLQNDSQLLNMVLREIEILQQLKGEHIVRLLDTYRSDHNLYIIMDYCDSGNLKQKLEEDQALIEPEICSIIKQIADAFVTLDKLDIVDPEGRKIVIMHRDIKLENVLIHQGKIKLADFGFAKIIQDINKSELLGHSLLGTPSYMSPQILNNEPYSAKCDVWSTGVMMYRLLFGIRPWDGKGESEIFRNVMSKPLEFPVSTSDEIEDLLTKMLKVDEKERLSWKQVYDHPALKDYEA